MVVRQIIPERIYDINADLVVFNPIKRDLELTLERVRTQSYGKYPSRLFATFVFPDSDLYESLWRPKLHLDNGYTLLRLKTDEEVYWFNAYILDDANGNNHDEISRRYWRSGRSVYDANQQGFLCEGICSSNLKIIDVINKM